MALPNPNPGGPGGAAVVQFPGGSGGSSKPPPPTKAATTLVTLTKDLINIQKNVLNMLNIIDMRLDKFFGDPDEKRVAKDTTGSVAGDDLNLKEILEKSGGFGTIFGAALVAYALDLDKYIRVFLLGKSIQQFSKIPKAFGVLLTGVSDFFKKLGTGQFLKGEFFKVFGKGSKFADFMQDLSKLFTRFVNFFGPIGKVIKSVINFFGGVGVKVGQGFQLLGKVFSQIGKFVNTVILGPFKAIGKLIGPLLTGASKFALLAKGIPIIGQVIAVIFGVFDFVKGFIKGFSEEGFVGGLKEGFMELMRGIFTKPIDLLTKGISYLAGFFGFDSIKATIDEFLQGGGFTGLFNDMMAALGKAFDVVLQFFKDLFKDPIGTLKSAAENIGDFFVDIAKSIGNTISSMKEGLLEMLGLSGESTQAERGGGGGTSFNISELFGGLDFEFPSVENILGSVGEKINAAFQSIAEGIDKSTFVPNAIGGFFSDAGVSLAEFMGAKNIEKYNVDTKQMDTLKQAAPRTASEGTAAGEMSKEVAAKKEAPSGPAVIDSSTKSGDTINNSQKTEMAAAPVSSRPMHNPAAGRRRRGRGGR